MKLTTRIDSEFFTVGYTVSFRVDWGKKVDLRFFCDLLGEQN